MNPSRTFRLVLPILFSALVLNACGTGSGAPVVQNDLTTTQSVSNYNGPPPATEDVQAFKLAVWDNLVPNNRCGSCHNESQNPRFVRADDINLAYDAANGIVTLSDPGDSLMVTKVRGGHNCWLADANACADIIESYIENWAGDAFGGEGKEIELVAPAVLAPPGDSRNFPADPPPAFDELHGLLMQYCDQCHSDASAVPQSPYFASEDENVAWAAAISKIDLDTPEDSRFVVRLSQESHNCWSDCGSNADEMEQAIITLQQAIPITVINENLVTSMALGLPNGIIAASGGRHERNLIAMWEFKTGSGNQAYDTSGVEPSLNLTLSGEYDWVGGWGVAFMDGKAQGSTQASAKLYDLITATGEFALEMWVAPGNVTQDGPARIVTYSGNATSRNFMVGQTLYNYDTFVRNDPADAEGMPLSTPDADEVLQASLQHVVVNYDPINGRRLFVNGESIDVTDQTPPDLLDVWDDTFAFAIGSEVDGSDPWAGTVRMMAIHNRILTPEQVFENFEVGVGERYYLLFNVGDHVNIPDAYVVFEVSQFDSYAYLFNEPFFVILDPAGVTIGNIPLHGMRIGVNGREAPVGQAYANLDVTLNDVDYADEGLQRLSRLGTVIRLEKGPDLDEFFLTFERLGDSENVIAYVEPDPDPLPAPPPLPQEDQDPPSGIRTFAEINATMSKITGVPVSEPGVQAVYTQVFQAMPVQPKIAGFISSQQMGITQLAFEYCSALVNDPTDRAAFWPDFPWGTSKDTAFNDMTQVTGPLIEKVVGLSLAGQPAPASIEAEVGFLVNNVLRPGSGDTNAIMKGACAAVLGSAAMLVQ